MNPILRQSFAIAATALCLACMARANTPYGYAGNAGWIGFGPASAVPVHSGSTFLSGFAYAANFGWIDFGDGAPASGSAYSNSSVGDHGVNHDGTGILSGYAYSANVGWINFSWANANDPNRPRVDLVTGIAAGFAYSANVDWIDLNGLTMPGVTATARFSAGSSTPITGGAVALAVSAGGTETLTFQWSFNGVAIAGATGSTFSLPSAQRFHAGDYTVLIIRADGSTFLVSPAALAVTAPPANDARLLNLSTRGLAQAGDNILIPGFVVSGSGTKRLLLRAVGPTLGKAPFSLAGVLPDPRMRLLRRNSATQLFEEIAANDNWADNSNAAAITQTAADLFAFGFNDALESALLMELEPGEYTVNTGGANNATGLAIVELYDADSGSPGTRLANISNRGFCGVGDQVMIPGFVVSSEGPKTVLVRVVGPTLGGFGVAGTMADPKLTIFSGQSAILANDNWSDNPDAATTAQIAQQVFAFPLTNGSKDAAFVVTLPPGAYTVVGSSATAGGTGVVLVELYVVL